jgi:hypothetical protein
MNLTAHLPAERRTHVEARLAANQIAWLTTVRPSGQPETVPVWFYVGDGAGTYTFTHVAAGPYDIAVTPPTGYTAPAPLTGVAVAATDVTGQNFALTRPGSVTGTVTDSATTAPLVGVTVTLARAGSAQNATTDTDGDYFFANVLAGTYQLTLTLPAAYQSATPVTRSITITAAGEIIESDFAVDAATLASTGADPSPALVIGLLLVAVGVLLLVAGRRRPTGRDRT